MAKLYFRFRICVCVILISQLGMFVTLTKSNVNHKYFNDLYRLLHFDNNIRSAMKRRDGNSNLSPDRRLNVLIVVRGIIITANERILNIHVHPHPVVTMKLETENKIYKCLLASDC